MNECFKYKVYKLYVYCSVLIVFIVALFGYGTYAYTTNEQTQTMILCTVVASIIAQIVGGIGTALYCLIDNERRPDDEKQKL